MHELQRDNFCFIPDIADTASHKMGAGIGFHNNKRGRAHRQKLH